MSNSLHDATAAIPVAERSAAAPPPAAAERAAVQSPIPVAERSAARSPLPGTEPVAAESPRAAVESPLPGAQPVAAESPRAAVESPLPGAQPPGAAELRAPAAESPATTLPARRFPAARLIGPARRATVPLLLVLLWQVASWAGWLDSATLASPIQVWHAFTDRWASGELWPSILTSLRRVLLGLAIGVSIGTVLGLAAGLSRLGEELVDAPLQMLRALPFLGLMPLLIVWLGIGEGVKVGLVVIGVIFPIYLNLHKGIRAVDPRFAELSRACGVGRWGVIRKVVLPGALPAFLVGLRFSLGIAWLSLVIAETVNADKGIGYLIMQGQQYLETDVIVMGLVIYALLGLLMEGLVRLIEWRTLPWRRDFVSR